MRVNEYDLSTGAVTVKTIEKPKQTPEDRRDAARRAIMARWKDKTRVTPATLELVREACADGATVGNICAVLGISDWQFRNWRDKYPEFGEAVKAGRSIEHDRLANKLVEMALLGNVACLIFALKSRHNYNDAGTGTVIENKVAITFQLPAALAPEQYLKTLVASADVITPAAATLVLAKPGIKGKVIKALAMEAADDNG